MLIDESQAQHFIDHYQTLLGHVAIVGGLLKKPVDSGGVLALMQKARNTLAQKKSLLDKAARAMEQAGEPLPQDMYEAASSLRVSHWVYLRDTSSYSVLLESGGLEAAYGVKCLTTTLKDAVGDSGAIIETGLLEYRGQIVCDDLIALAAWLGPQHRAGFNAQLRELRAEGRFHRGRLLPLPGAKPARRAA